MNSKISLVVPVFNESGEIENFFNNLKKCNFKLINEIIFIDDFSTDNSLNLIKKKIDQLKYSISDVNFFVISNLKNRGYGFSIKKGVDNSKNDIIAIIDLDRSYRIEDLNNISHEFINIHELKYDLIIGERKIDFSNTSRIKII